MLRNKDPKNIIEKGYSKEKDPNFHAWQLDQFEKYKDMKDSNCVIEQSVLAQNIANQQDNTANESKNVPEWNSSKDSILPGNFLA